DPKTMQFQNLKTDNILDGTNTGPTPSSLREALNNISETESQNKGNTGSGGGFTIICSELYRQGLMSTDIYRADSIFGMDVREHNPNVMIGYHLLCRPIVQLMKKSKIITNIVNIFAKPWSYEMAFQMGVKKEGYIMGKVIMSVGIPICATVGKIVSNDSQIFDTMMAVLFFAFLVLVFNVIMKRWKSGSDTI
ncbi:MAG: hypothetical protein KKE61_07960, partial [Proteobacteria bacterium]|nr:hypothetical protein [Pseudomonadota bacterium]